MKQLCAKMGHVILPSVLWIFRLSVLLQPSPSPDISRCDFFDPLRKASPKSSIFSVSNRNSKVRDDGTRGDSC